MVGIGVLASMIVWLPRIVQPPSRTAAVADRPVTHALDGKELIELIESLANGPDQPIALVDTEIRQICKLNEIGDALARTPRGATG